MKFYVYELINPINNKVFYIGKGTGDRAKYHQSHIEKYNKDICNNKHKYDIIKNVLNEDLDVKINYVFMSDDESECYKKENDLIEFYGIENLTNIYFSRDSGKLSESVKNGLKNSEKNKERLKYIKTKEYKEKCRQNNLGDKNPFYGKTWNSLQRKSIVEANKKPKSDSHRKKISNSLKNSMKLKESRSSNEWKDKLSNSLKTSEKFQSVMKSDEYRKKQSNLATGKNNPRAKKFKFTSPDGNEFIVHGGFDKFIKENKLSRYHMLNVKDGKKDNYNGWKVDEVEG